MFKLTFPIFYYHLLEIFYGTATGDFFYCPQDKLLKIIKNHELIQQSDAILSKTSTQLKTADFKC